MNKIRLGRMLRSCGVNTCNWGIGEAKTVDHLLSEIIKQECYLKLDHSGITRVLQVVKMEIKDPELGTLIEESQTLPDGRIRKRGMTPAGKISMRETPEEAMFRETKEEFGLEPQMFSPTLAKMFKLVGNSPSYPGLKNEYNFVVFHIKLEPAVLEMFRSGKETIEKDGTKHTFAWKKK